MYVSRLIRPFVNCLVSLFLLLARHDLRSPSQPRQQHARHDREGAENLRCVIGSPSHSQANDIATIGTRFE